MATKLTDKQKRFCIEYMKRFNATEAYVAAGYSKKGADTNAAKLIGNYRIQAYLCSLRDKKISRDSGLEISMERVLIELGRVAFSDLRNVVEVGEEGDRLVVRDFNALPRDVTAAISEVRSQTSYDDQNNPIVTKSVKSHNKMAALSLLSKHFGITEDFNVARMALRRYQIDLYPRSEPDENGFMWGAREYVPGETATASPEAIAEAEERFIGTSEEE